MIRKYARVWKTEAAPKKYRVAANKKATEVMSPGDDDAKVLWIIEIPNLRINSLFGLPVQFCSGSRIYRELILKKNYTVYAVMDTEPL